MFCFSFYEREQLKRRTECCKTVPLAGVYPLRHIHPRNLFPQAGPEQTKIHINFNVNFKNFIRMHKNKSTLTDFRKLEKKNYHQHMDPTRMSILLSWVGHIIPCPFQGTSFSFGKRTEKIKINQVFVLNVVLIQYVVVFSYAWSFKVMFHCNKIHWQNNFVVQQDSKHNTLWQVSSIN